jgi:hypothetical protein
LILAVEGTWFKHQGEPYLHYVLSMIERVYGTPYRHYRAHTLAQLESGLKALDPTPNWDTLYIATHGRPGKLKFARDFLPVNELADMMGTKFEGCAVLLSACSVMNTDMSYFVKTTKVAGVVGYTVDVDFVIGSSLDQIILYSLQEYGSMKWWWRYIQKNFRQVINDRMRIEFAP